MNIVSIILYGLLTCAVALMTPALDNRHNKKSGGRVETVRNEEDIHRRNARYYYLEGLKKQNEGDAASAYAYFYHAAKCDETYAEALSSYGTMRMTVATDTLQTPNEIYRSLTFLQPFVDQYPEEVNENQFYAYMAGKLNLLPEAIRVLERTDSLVPSNTETLIHLSQAYVVNGEFDKSISALQKYEDIEGMSPQVTVRKITTYLAQRDSLKALNEAEALIRHNPMEPANLMLKGDLYNMMNRPDSAILYYQRAEDVNPDYGAAKIALADIYRQRGDSAAYDNYTYQALLSEEYELSQKLELAGEYLQGLLQSKGDTRRGDALFETLRTQYPHEAEVIELSARYSAAKGNLPKAIEEVSYAIDQKPSEEQYRIQLMRYYLADQRADDAVGAYMEALNVFTPSPAMKYLYASALQIGKHYDEAIGAYKELIKEIVPGVEADRELTTADIPRTISLDQMNRLSDLFTTIGDCLQLSDSVKNTITAYNNALLFNPDNILTLNNYAYYLSEHGGDMQKAAEMSDKSLRINGGEGAKNPTYLDTYAWIQYKLGNYGEARKYQADAIKIVNSDENQDAHVELFEHYGDILAADKAIDEALLYYEKALKLEPNNKTITEKIKKLKNVKK